MAAHPDPLAHAENTARDWLARISTALGTDDHHYVYRVLRAWLHAVRDRLTIDSAAHFGAQLPELLRGTFFEGWTPHRVPLRYDTAAFAARFATEARIGLSDVPATTRALTNALREQFSPGQLDHALALMPRALRTEFFDTTPPRPEPQPEPAIRDLDRLRDDIDLLADALSTLAHGLEHRAVDEPDGERAQQAAHTVHDIMLARQTAHSRA